MPNNKINSSSVKTQENQPEGSLDLNKMIQDPSNAELIDNSQAQQNKLFGLLKQSIKDFSMLPAEKQILAVSAAGALFATALPLLLAAVPLAATGAMIGLALFFSVKAVQFGYKGLKWSAEKTVDGVKYTAGKVRDGAVHVKDKVKEGYEHSVDSLKKGASFVGEGVANKFHKASGETDYLDKVKRFTPDAIKKSDEIRNDMKAIFADKGNNSGLVKNVLSGISSEIDLKMAEKAKSGEIEHTSGWQVQKEFINNLNEKSLHNLLTQRSLPKGSYFIDSVFSEHYDEIKKVIKECRENHLYSSVSNMFDRAEKKANRPSVKNLTRSVSSSFSSLGRKGSEQSNSLSKSNSLNSVKTDSTVSSEAELLNPAEHKEVKQSSGFFSRFKRNEPLKEATDISLNPIGTESTATVSDSDSQNFATVRRSNSSSSLTPKLTPVAPPKVPESPSIDSGMGSGSSTPRSPSVEDLSKARANLKETGYLNELVKQPSTKVAVDTDVQQQAAQTAVKTN